MPIVPQGWHYHVFDFRTGLLDEYYWEIRTDTSELGDNNCLRSFIQNIIDNIYVSFDYSPPGEKLYNAFFK